MRCTRPPASPARTSHRLICRQQERTSGVVPSLVAAMAQGAPPPCRLARYQLRGSCAGSDGPTVGGTGGGPSPIAQPPPPHPPPAASQTHRVRLCNRQQAGSCTLRQRHMQQRVGVQLQAERPHVLPLVKQLHIAGKPTRYCRAPRVLALEADACPTPFPASRAGMGGRASEGLRLRGGAAPGASVASRPTAATQLHAPGRTLGRPPAAAAATPAPQAPARGAAPAVPAALARSSRLWRPRFRWLLPAAPRLTAPLLRAAVGAGTASAPQPPATVSKAACRHVVAAGRGWQQAALRSSTEGSCVCRRRLCVHRPSPHSSRLPHPNPRRP